MVLQIKPLTVEAFEEFIRLPENIDRDFEYIGEKFLKWCLIQNLQNLGRE